jgi:hypothetical protein
MMMTSLGESSRQTSFDIVQEAAAIDRAVEHARRADAITAQSR